MIDRERLKARREQLLIEEQEAAQQIANWNSKMIEARGRRLEIERLIQAMEQPPTEQ